MSKRVAAGQSVSVSVPASSGNVGPGFDSLGLALNLQDQLTVTTTDINGQLDVVVTGEGAGEVPEDANHLIIRVMTQLWQQAGWSPPGLVLRAENLIPHGRGLGSSAAAAVSGALAANALLPAAARLSGDEVLQLCSELEGHPDNVAPSLDGSLAISWHQDGRYRTAKVDVLEQVIPIVAIPSVPVSTDVARALLPHSVSHLSAATNAGRTALLIHALTRDPSYLREATEDSLHQGYRASAMLPSATLMRAMRARGFAATISGAGPTVLTLANGPEHGREVVRALHELLDDSAIAGTWRVLNLKVASEGAKLVVHQR